MALAVALGIALVVFVFLMMAKRLETASACWVKEKWRTVSQKLAVALLSGFIGFVLLTPEIPSWTQKIVLVMVTALLIAANSIQLPFHKEC